MFDDFTFGLATVRHLNGIHSQLDGMPIENHFAG
jgi:hypothetical protein